MKVISNCDDNLFESTVEWIRQNSPARTPSEALITMDTDLFATELLDSIGLLALIAFIETKTERVIDVLEISPKDLVTLRGLFNAALAQKFTPPTG